MDIANPVLELDSLSRVFLAAFLLVGVAGVVYVWSLQRSATVAALALGLIASAAGVVVARDFLGFLIAWELTVLLACCLIVHDRRPASFAVAYRYFLVQIAGGVSLFLAICIHYAETESLTLTSPSPRAVPFFLVAFLVKAAVIPFHVWVPMTYPSVTPGIAVILSAYSTKIGVYAFARLLPGMHGVAFVGAFMALFGVVMALRQVTARRLLSYHLLSQVGYMLAGIGLGTELGVAAGAFHMLNHVFYKSLLFMAAGAILHRTGTDVLKNVAGAGRSMPITMAAAFVGAAAICGLPPLNGFLSKTILKTAAQEHALLQTMLLAAGIGTSLSFTKFLWRLFLLKETDAGRPSHSPVAEVPLGACLGMALLAAICLAQGIVYPRFFPMALETTSVDVFSMSNVLSGAGIVCLGAVLFIVLKAVERAFAVKNAIRLPRNIRGKQARISAARRKASGSEPTPWDIDRVYAWLLDRLLCAAHAIALRARDETQAYLLAIVILTVSLIGFLAWCH